MSRWSFDWGVQANQSNHFKVLILHGLVLSVEVKGSVPVCMEIQIQVGAKKLNEMRVNPCRSVVNNFLYCQNQREGGLARQSLTSVKPATAGKPDYWSDGNRHIEGRSFAYGSIMEQEKQIFAVKEDG